MSAWKETIHHTGRRVEAASDGARAVLWEGESVLVRGRVRGMVELVEPVRIEGTDDDVEILRQWLRGLMS